MRVSVLSIVGLVLALTGCNKHSASDAANEAAAQNTQAPAPMPPAVKESHVYRCAGNGIIYVDFLTDDRTANLQLGSMEAPIVRLTAPEAGKPFEGGDYSLSGEGATVKLTKKGEAAKTCKA